MAPKKTKLVTLKLASSKLKQFNIPEPAKKKKQPVIKAATPASPAQVGGDDAATGVSTPVKSSLGPRLGLGAINAQLRALDRSGKPCRKWTKLPIHLKSFTGFKYTVPGWNGGPREVKEDEPKLKSEEVAESVSKEPTAEPTVEPGVAAEPVKVEM